MLCFLDCTKHLEGSSQSCCCLFLVYFGSVEWFHEWLLPEFFVVLKLWEQEFENPKSDTRYFRLHIASF